MPGDENPLLGPLPAGVVIPPEQRSGLIGLVRADATTGQAEQELNAMFSRLQLLETNAKPGADRGVLPLSFETLRNYLYGGAPPGLRLLMDGAILMLLCTVAAAIGLFVARYEERSAELSLRLFLGASPVALIRHLLAESLTLTLAGAAVGLAGAAYLLAWVRRGPAGSLPQLSALGLSVTAASAAAVAAFMILLLSGVRHGSR